VKDQQIVDRRDGERHGWRAIDDEARQDALARSSADLEAPATTTVPLWFQLVTWVLSVAGLGVSIYLTIAHFTDKPLAGCSESGLVNCTKVTTSPQSYVFGIPVAVLGLAFFIAAVGLMSPCAWRWARREVALIRIASLVVGMGFVLYLLYAELFTIGQLARVERYWQLLAIINGQPVPPSVVPSFDWLIAALRSGTRVSAHPET